MKTFTAGPSKMASQEADKPVEAKGVKYTVCPGGLVTRFTPKPDQTPAIFRAIPLGDTLKGVA